MEWWQLFPTLVYSARRKINTYRNIPSSMVMPSIVCYPQKIIIGVC